ncbi:MOSC domain-containing protein [Bradyrhizobium canariense]
MPASRSQRGDLGENITTAGLDLERMPLGTVIELGPTALVELTGLRTPCILIDRFRAGLKRQVLSSAETGPPFECGVLGVVRVGGAVVPGHSAPVLAISRLAGSVGPLQEAFALARSRASRRRSRRSRRRLARSGGCRSGGTCVAATIRAGASSTKGAWIGSVAVGRASMNSSTVRPLAVICHPLPILRSLIGRHKEYLAKLVCPKGMDEEVRIA